MKPVIIGGVVAVLVIGAFLLGMSGALEPETPAEKLGESLESAADKVDEGLKDVGKGIEKATGKE